MDKLLRQWAELEPELVQANESGVVIQGERTLDFIYFDAELNYGMVQIAVQHAIARHNIRISLDYFPDEQQWNASLFLPTDTVTDPDRGWDGEDGELAIALLTAYLKYLES